MSNSGHHNSGNRNSGNFNSGYWNSGHHNSGDCNSGHRNSGNCNSSHWNSGRCNSGNCNSGDWNSGDRNSGHWNSGEFNSGDFNSGNRNSGNYNSGHHNSGRCNSGNCNSGDHNSGNCNSGFFNTNKPTIRLFNKDSGLAFDEIDIPHINLPVTEWIPEEKMTKKQKKDDPNFHIKGGTLIERSYKEAWQIAWSELPSEDKDRFLNLPNFDANIFEEITGINVDKKDCNGKIVEVDGKKYKLEEV